MLHTPDINEMSDDQQYNDGDSFFDFVQHLTIPLTTHNHQVKLSSLLNNILY